jgi:alpha-ketoglutarate-dependent taurine dioxygenase
MARNAVCARHECRGLATAPAVATVPHIIAKDISDAGQPRHVKEVRDRLEHDGILKISLRFADDTSQYLKTLVLNLHKHHGHGLPITHSASQGWFWDVKPTRTSFQTQNHQARSETMADFPWHTDCSYEPCPPRFFALHVLHPDRYGGGTLSVMNVQRLTQRLSPSARDALSRPDYRISIPLEFVKKPDQPHIVGSILAGPAIRYRGELVTPLNEGAAEALHELKRLLREGSGLSSSTLHLAASDLPRNSIILLDNRRWLHARDAVKDPARHLRRARWDAVPF